MTEDGIPILLRDDVEDPHGAARWSLEQANEPASVVDRGTAAVDAFVQATIRGTCGNLYAHLTHSLARYPIPALRISRPAQTAFLDIGCHWGRWCVSAARRGWRVVGLDPNLEAIRAAKRVASELHVDASFVVGDARYLPFADATFDTIHAYSVLQHFDRRDVVRTASDIARVLNAGGVSYIQMARTLGLRNIIQQTRRGFRRPRDFDVRYWSSRDLLRVFGDAVGPTVLAADSFFSLNAQAEDLDLLKPHHRLVVRLSNRLRELNERWPALAGLADSVYVRSTKATGLIA